MLFIDSKHLLQRFGLEKVLENHRGCVNSVQWNEAGSLLLTAGDDKHIMITNPFSYKVVVDYETKHKTNIFCAKFLPTSNNCVISSGGDGSVLNIGINFIIYNIYTYLIYIFLILFYFFMQRFGKNQGNRMEFFYMPL